MTRYTILIDSDALIDIQDATDWYNKQLPGLGTRFQKQVRLQVNTLKTNAESFTTRYANVRCMVIRKFPFLVHFVLNRNEMTVEIFAVIHTSRNPKIWEEKRYKK